ncbi:MAG: glycosyltransferase [Lachnospiraceae bacterium]|jgi:biotin carboxylase|nr:glycosyltransferase [Lachnospiraceae bacterium]
MDSVTLGIVIPVFGSTESVARLIRQIHTVFSSVCTYHIYLVDDGNPEKIASWLRKHCDFPEITLIRLKRNYGQQNAVLCGIRHAGNCRYIATMDDDLQHSPNTLFTLYQTILKGFDIVYAVPRADSGMHLPFRAKHSPLRILGSQMRDLLFRILLKLPSHIKVSSFRIMTRELAREISGEAAGFFYLSAAVFSRPRKAMTCYYPATPRPYGRSGYTLKKLAALYWNIICFYGPAASLFLSPKRRSSVLYEESTIMILGGSNCQLHAIKRARKNGHRVILADYTDHPPGADYAHVHDRISTFDIDGCTKTARREHADAVMTMGTDQPVYTAACVSHRLGLPSFLTPEKALAVTNKKIMKQILAKHKIPTAPWMLIDGHTAASDLDFLAPPLVIKPLDSQGQRGIFKCSQAAELLSCLPETLSFSKSSQALAEQFYPSDEITVSGWVSQGHLTILTVSDRLLYPDPVHIGICIGHRFPSVHMNRFPEIERLSQQVADAFQLTEGPFYLQLLIGEEGIRVNELACRIGGAFEDVVIPYLTGFDILEAVIDLSFGKSVSLNLSPDFRADNIHRCAAVQLTFCHPGVIASCTPIEQLKLLPFLLDCGYNYHPGQEIPPAYNATARFGHGVITGTPGTIAAYIRQFYEAFQVLSPTGESLVNRLYPEK